MNLNLWVTQIFVVVVLLNERAFAGPAESGISCQQSLTTHVLSENYDLVIDELVAIVREFQDHQSKQALGSRTENSLWPLLVTNLLYTKRVELESRFGVQATGQIFREVQQRFFKTLHVDSDRMTNELPTNKTERSAIVFNPTFLRKFNNIHVGFVSTVALDPALTKVLWASGQTSRILDLNNPEHPAIHVPRRSTNDPVSTFSHDGRKILIGGGPNFELGVFSLERLSGLEWSVNFINSADLLLKGHRNQLIGAEYTYDDRMIVSLSKDGKAYVWDASNGELLYEIKGPYGAGGPRGFALAQEKHKMVFFLNESVRNFVYDLDQKMFIEFDANEPIHHVAINDSGTQALSVSEGKVYQWDAHSGKKQWVSNLENHGPLTAAYFPSGSQYVLVLGAKKLILLDRSNGSQLRVEDFPVDLADSVIAHKARVLVDISSAFTMSIWNLFERLTIE